jgi:hypothetical protein
VELKAIIDRLERGENVPKYSLSKGIFYFFGRARCERKTLLPMATVDMVFQYFNSSPLGGHLGLFKRSVKLVRILHEKAYTGTFVDVSENVENVGLVNLHRILSGVCWLGMSMLVLWKS